MVSFRNSTQVTIEELKAYTEYQFKVRSVNNNSDSNVFSETIECYTYEDVPGKVSNIEWFSVNNTLIRVEWKEPNELNGIIQSYVVGYLIEKSEAPVTWNNIAVSGNQTSLNLTNLLPGKRYMVRIQAATKAGFGAYSDPIIASTSSKDINSSTLDQENSIKKVTDDKQLGKHRDHYY